MTDPIVIEAHVGWRGELGDFTPRVEVGVEGRWRALGVELNGGGRFAATEYSGHLAAQELLSSDGSWYVFRDDRWTGGLMLDWRPWWTVPFGPVVGVGGELADTRETTFGEEPVELTRTMLTGWFTARVGVEARIQRVGVRLTLADRLTSLERPDYWEAITDPALVQIWRVGVDVLVRL